MERQLVLIANMASKNSKKQSKKYQQILIYFELQNLKVHLFQTKTILELHQVVEQCHVKGYTEYISLGGDGSLNAMINAILNCNELNFDQLKIGCILLERVTIG